MLPQTTSDEHRTRAFSAYNVVGQAIGAVGSGAAAVPALLGAEPLAGYRAHVGLCRYGPGTGGAVARLSDPVEASTRKDSRQRGVAFGSARGTVLKLAGLYALDSLGSGFVVQGLVFYWFNLRYGIDIKGLGAIAVGADALAAASFLVAPWVAAHVGLLLAAILPRTPLPVRAKRGVPASAVSGVSCCGARHERRNSVDPEGTRGNRGEVPPARAARDERRADDGRRLAACGVAVTRAAVGAVSVTRGRRWGAFPGPWLMTRLTVDSSVSDLVDDRLLCAQACVVLTPALLDTLPGIQAFALEATRF